MRFLLVEPQHPGNVGAAARALKNLGFDRLVLVAPRCDPADADARRMAVDASDLLESCEVHADLDAALAGARTVVGTSARTGKQRKPHWRLDALRAEGKLAASDDTAFVFGREAHGLSDEELDRCTHLVHLPAASVYPSFNLAQAVLLVAYEVRLALAGEPAPATEPPAAHERREPMFGHLQEALLAIGFLSEETAPSLMRQLRRLVGRAGATEEEVRILRGIARQTLWAAGRAARNDGKDGDV